MPFFKLQVTSSKIGKNAHFWAKILKDGWQDGWQNFKNQGFSQNDNIYCISGFV
jgi:hypothetical protein